MSFKGVLEADVKAVFLNPDEFADLIEYTPRGGSVKTIPALIREPTVEEFMQGNVVLAYTARRVLISGVNDSEGHVSPKTRAKPGDDGGDTLKLPNDERTWHVQHLEQSDGRVHELMIVDNPAVPG